MPAATRATARRSFFFIGCPISIPTAPQVLAARYTTAQDYERMHYLEKAKRVLDAEIFELGRLRERLDERFGRAIELIKEAVEARGKVVVLGVGKSGHVGAKIAATLTSTGSPAVVLDSLNAMHGDLGMVADGDVVLALSSSGETEELLRIIPALARFKVRIIAMCGDP